MNYVNDGYVEAGYFEGDSAPSAVSCDLTDVGVQLDENSNDLKTILANFNTMLNAVNNNFGALSLSIQAVAAKVDAVKSDTVEAKDFLSLQSFQSLNGNGSEFKDGVSVLISGRSTVYTVERSFVSLYTDNGYTVHYDLASADGYKCTVPEALLTKYVEAV